jgi:tRNA A37 threonylcarbamoyladenosine dehydratase
MALSEKEIQYFKNPIAVPGMGLSMQEKLKDARVLVVGAGGLGCPVIQYLSLSGIGVIGIADYGTIREEDMHRQPLYQLQNLKKYKATMAASRLWGTNPFTKHYPMLLQVKPDNIGALLEGMDLVIDCSQHPATHLIINDACIKHNKPFVIAEVHNWIAWWAGFNIPSADGSTPASFRCAQERIAEYRNFDAGAMAVTHGATGMQVANEVVKYLIDVRGGLAGKLYSMDYLHNNLEIHQLEANNDILASTIANGILTAEDYGIEILPDIED